MAKATIAGAFPKQIELEAGKTYSYCTCGESKNQPFCDGAHAGTDFKPVTFKQEVTEKKALCMFKQNNGSPFCNGAHSKI